MTNRETPQATSTRPGPRPALTRPPAQRASSGATGPGTSPDRRSDSTAAGTAPADTGWIRVTPLNRALSAPAPAAATGGTGAEVAGTTERRAPGPRTGATAAGKAGTTPDRAAKVWAPAPGRPTAGTGAGAGARARGAGTSATTTARGTAATADADRAESTAEPRKAAVTPGVQGTQAKAKAPEAGTETREATVAADTRRTKAKAAAERAEAAAEPRRATVVPGAQGTRAKAKAPEAGAEAAREAGAGVRAREVPGGAYGAGRGRRIVPAPRSAGVRERVYAPGDEPTYAPRDDEPAPVRLRTVRGRHRKPRRRRVLFAAGGLALAAGVLSLARMTPDSVTGHADAGATEAEPIATATDNDVADDAVPTVAAMPSPTRAGAAPASPAMGGTSPAPTSDASRIPASVRTPAATVPAARGAAPVATPPGSTGIPTAPVTTAPPARSTPPATTPAEVPRHTPSPAPTAQAPSHQPPDVCVPIVGICVNELLSPGQDGR
ncbi:hypothetical protein [Streptomyces sp. NBC_00151]|uniref:hypothetical protein n=1 Tax=Streptomyces sp. NBC_00151 TaxID=2975669 RepID=UPI002DD901B3|nr:hypothetical protein [Streptomyces sp. NBC_00151]WRZ39784.1 hypothetical protein OG915_18055 [Streptomyces sp. NBC_00151]